MKGFPSTRLGWHDWYAQRYNKTKKEIAATQAIWFYLNYLAFGDRSYSPQKAKT